MVRWGRVERGRCGLLFQPMVGHCPAGLCRGSASGEVRTARKSRLTTTKPLDPQGPLVVRDQGLFLFVRIVLGVFGFFVGLGDNFFTLGDTFAVGLELLFIAE